VGEPCGSPTFEPRRAGRRTVSIDPLPPRVRRAPRHRRPWRTAALVAVGAVLLFGLGVALGLALDDRPVPGGTQTFVRTLEPLPQQAP